MTESSKSPPRPEPRPASAPHAAPAPAPAASPVERAAPHGPPPAPLRSPTRGSAELAERAGALPPPGPHLTREAPRDTLAPSSFGNLGARPLPAATPTGLRSARAPLPTLGELDGASATATLRPPGAVPPPPRALPTATPSPESIAERHTALETPLPRAPEPLAATLDMEGSAAKRAVQAALVEQTRRSEARAASSAVPAPGLYIADEPLEPRPDPGARVTGPQRELSRLRAAMLVLGGLLLMAAGALVALLFRRAEASASRQLQATSASASVAAPTPPACALAAPPSRISPIQRSVPIAARTSTDGDVLLAFADTKTSAVSYLYRPLSGDVERQQSLPGEAEVTHVSLTEPPSATRASADFSLGQTLAPGLELGVGPSGILRRGGDGATGVVWALPTGARVTQPRVLARPGAYFVTFRQGGAEGQILSGWLRADGSAASELTPVADLPPNLGTPTVALLGERALVLVSARAHKSAPYRVYAALAAAGRAPEPARALDAPGEGGGSIAPSLAALPGGQTLLQWTEGHVGRYQVRVRVLDAELAPLAAPVLVSPKGANAGQGVLAPTARGAVSLFIQTTAGHDELWGVTLACQ